jgi:hypothetical protein
MLTKRTTTKKRKNENGGLIFPKNGPHPLFRTLHLVMGAPG